MRTLILLGLLACAGNLLATALPNVKVSLTGTIITDNKAPLEYATVSIFAADSSLVDGTVTNEQGMFDLDLPTGAYRIQFEFLGFTTQRKNIELTRKTDLGIIQMSPDGLTLDAVEVTADKTQMNLFLDKKIFNVGTDLTSAGGSANEVLDQLPSVTVSVDGQVSLRGDSGVRILINGRPSAIANNNALDGIPAESIEKVELITNPSAKYEAAGTAGIINIILKKSQQRGYGGTASFSAGYPRDLRANLNLNIRREKFNAFGSVGYRFSDYQGTGSLTRRSTLNEGTTNLQQDRLQARNDKNVTGFAGFDYNISPTDMLTASYSLYDVINDDLATIDFDYTDDNGAPLQTTRQTLDYLEPGKYQTIEFTYTKTLKKEGEKLTFFAQNDFWTEPEYEDITFEESFPTMAQNLRYRTESLEGSRDYLLQVDYESPVGENGKIETGLRGETRIIYSDYLAERNEDGIWSPLEGFKNDFDYYERIGSGYLQYAWNKDALSFQVGLRNEYTVVRIENEASPENDVTKPYNRIFPSASASFKLSDETSTQLSYSKRIRRPSFGLLNPFGGIGDPNSIFSGNPDLNPTYTDRLEWNLIRRWEKLTINPAIYASTAVDFFAFVIDQSTDNPFGLETGTITVLPMNLDRENRYGLEVNVNYRPAKSINLSGEINYYGYQQRGEVEGQSFDFDFATWSGSLRSNIDLPKDISFQAVLYYDAPFKTVQSIRDPQYYLRMGLSKQWDNKFTLTANLAAPRIQSSSNTLATFSETERNQWTRWRGSLNFQYRFEKGAGARERRQRGSIR
ncbi:MAG: TonB-dependent receptor [Lewinella sp.]